MKEDSLTPTDQPKIDEAHEEYANKVNTILQTLEGCSYGYSQRLLWDIQERIKNKCVLQLGD